MVYSLLVIKAENTSTQSLQDINRELRSKENVSETSKPDTPSIEMIDFKTKFAESKAHAKVNSHC